MESQSLFVEALFLEICVKNSRTTFTFFFFPHFQMTIYNSFDHFRVQCGELYDRKSQQQSQRLFYSWNKTSKPTSVFNVNTRILPCFVNTGSWDRCRACAQLFSNVQPRKFLPESPWTIKQYYPLLYGIFVWIWNFAAGTKFSCSDLKCGFTDSQ